MDILKTRERSCDYILIDTPGQIEVFLWSASGQIIMQTLGAIYPTVISYVTDLKLNVNPITFVSNMTYAASIMYKSRLPMVLALNKVRIRFFLELNLQIMIK
jgi:GPN-loop GTPase